MAKTYTGKTPQTRCDMCQNPVGATVYDAKTIMGAWGILCFNCFVFHGVGLGVGLGQKYEWNPQTQEMEKVGG